MANSTAHGAEVGGCDQKTRNWELHSCSSKPIEPQTDLDCVVTDVITGPKWSGIREVLNTWDGWRDYDQIWLPDDDIAAGQDAISAMSDAVGLQLFARALRQSARV
jgi:hypothetical protein